MRDVLFDDPWASTTPGGLEAPESGGLAAPTYLEAGNQLVCPGTLGAELLDELKPDSRVELNGDLLLRGELQEVGPSEWLMYKPRWGAFYETGLEQHLRALDVDTVVAATSQTVLEPWSTKRASATSTSFSFVTPHQASMPAGWRN